MRKAMYFLTGILSAVIIFIFMLTTSPKVDVVSTSLADFNLIENGNKEKLRIENVNGTYSNFLEHGSYHVDEVDNDYYVSSGIVTYGKPNPMFYFVEKAAKPVEKEINDSSNVPTNNNQESTSAEKQDSNTNSQATEKFKNCEELRKTYPDGVKKGDPAYVESQDRDNDGKYCEVEGKSSESSTSNNVGGVEVVDLSKPVIVKGFNVITNQYETKDTAPALKDFKAHGRLPIDEEYYGVSSPFGERNDPFTQAKAVHTGLDMASQEIENKNVYAAVPGEIVAIKEGNTGYGNHVIIRHNGYETLYGHLSSFSNIKVGDEVQAGVVIGKVGSTGRSTSPHLHFEVRIDNVTVDPKAFISQIR